MAIVRSPAVLGIDEATRAELVDFGTKNLRAENVRTFNQGEAGPRYGFAALGNLRLDGTTPTAGYKLFANGTAPCRIVDNNVESYSATQSRWTALGHLPEATYRAIPLPVFSSSDAGGIVRTAVPSDVEICNGYIATTWATYTSATSAFAVTTIVDAATGTAVQLPTTVGPAMTSGLTGSVAIMNQTGGPFRIASYGTTFLLFVTDVVASTIKLYKLDTSVAANFATGWTLVGTVASDMGPTAYLSVCSLTDRVALVYVNSSTGTARVTVKTLDATGVLQVTNPVTVSSTILYVDIAGVQTDTLWVGWSDNSGNLRVTGLSPANITTTTATAVTVLTIVTTTHFTIAADESTPGSARLGISDGYTSSFSTTFATLQSSGGAATVTSTNKIPNLFLAGRMFHSSTTKRYYVPATAVDKLNSQSTIVLVDVSSVTATYARPVASIGPGGLVTAAGQCKCVSSGGKTYFAYNTTKSAVGIVPTLAEFDFLDSSKRWQVAALNGGVYLTGAALAFFDGRQVAEVGFLFRPTTPTLDTSTVGSLTLANGRRYIAVYEDIDSAGNWNVSGLSSPSVNSGAVTSKVVAVTTTPLSITARSASSVNLRVAIYATGDNGGVAPYYRLGTIANDTTATLLTFQDQTTDAVLTANAKLYEQPGVLGTAQDRRAPPGLSFITTYNGMLVGASGSDVWYSGQNVSGEGVWFNPIFQVPIPGDGDITAIWAMDGTLFVAKRRDIYALFGEAPSDNGASGGLGQPRRLAVDLGCIEPRSVCVTAMGTVFQSERGLEILTRAQTAQWIGQPIQKTLLSYPIVTAVTVDPSNTGAILVELAASQSAGLVTGAGRTLVMDLPSREWISTDRRASSAGVVDCPAQSACIIYTGSVYRYAWIDATGVVHYENRSTYLDANGSFVTPLIETGWINVFQNEQRVWRASILFQRYLAAGLKVEVAYNYGDYVATDNAVWTEVDTNGQIQLEMSPSPRAETMKFRITTTAPVTLGTGQGMGCFAIALDLAGKQGPTKGTVRLDPALRR